MLNFAAREINAKQIIHIFLIENQAITDEL